MGTNFRNPFFPKLLNPHSPKRCQARSWTFFWSWTHTMGSSSRLPPVYSNSHTLKALLKPSIGLSLLLYTVRRSWRRTHFLGVHDFVHASLPPPYSGTVPFSHFQHFILKEHLPLRLVVPFHHETEVRKNGEGEDPSLASQ